MNCVLVAGPDQSRYMASNLRVLLVEDEFIIALEYELLLRREGHEVVGVAAHAETALAIAREHEPDLALVDVNLRDGATGPEIAEYLNKALGISVLFVTANADALPDDLSGAMGVLGKPISGHTFCQIIRYVAGQIKGTSPEQTVPPELRMLKPKAERPPIGTAAAAD